MGVANSTKNTVTIYLTKVTVGKKRYKVGVVYGSDKVSSNSIIIDLNSYFGLISDENLVIDIDGNKSKIIGSTLVEHISDYDVIIAENCDFSLRLDTIGSTTYTNPYYIVNHPKTGDFVYIPKMNILDSLVMYTNFRDGICDDNDLVFVAVRKYYKLVSKRSAEYKEAIQALNEKKQYTLNKTKKWEIGNIYGTYTQKSVYLGKAYRLFDVELQRVNGDLHYILSNNIESTNNDIICNTAYLKEQFKLDNTLEADDFFRYYSDKIDELSRDNIIQHLAGKEYSQLPEGLNPFIKSNTINSTFNQTINSKTYCGKFINITDCVKYTEQLGRLLNKMREFILEFISFNSGIRVDASTVLPLLHWERPLVINDLTIDEKRVVGKLLNKAMDYSNNIPNYYGPSLGITPVKVKFITQDPDIEQFLQEYVYNIN